MNFKLYTKLAFVFLFAILYSNTAISQDIDSDGVADAVDLDDDNDGILDVNEGRRCGSVALANYIGLSSYSSTPSSQTFQQEGSAAGKNVKIELKNTTNDPSSTFVVSSTAAYKYRDQALGGSGNAIFINNMINSTEEKRVTITFDEAVYNLNFNMADLDYGNFAGPEKVTINAYLNDGTLFNLSNAKIIEYFFNTTTYAIDSFKDPYVMPMTGNTIDGGATYPHGVLNFSFPSTCALNSLQGFKKIEFIFTGSSTSDVSMTLSLFDIKYCGGPDTDGDCIVDFQDTDSDNDGCVDALEGSKNFTSSSLTSSSRLSGGVNTSGVPFIANGGQDNVSSTNATVKSAFCNSGALPGDYDGDGVQDINDLDDDNDGILDTKECSLVANEYGGTFGTSNVYLNRNLTTPVSNYSYASVTNNSAGEYAVINGYNNTWHPYFNTLTGHTTGTDNDAYLAVNGSTVQAIFYSQTVSLAPNTSYNIGLWAANANSIPSDALIYPAELGVRLKDANGNIVGQTSTGSMTTSQVWTQADISYTTGSTSANFTLEVYNISVGAAGNDFAIDDIYIKGCNDTDGDGILDYLDTDSDNDGCVDAMEGSSNFTTSSITTANRLTGGVDANGVPLIANGGQEKVSSTNAAVKSLYCCNITVTGDCDGDGIDNLIDCDPYNAAINYGQGSACTNSQGVAGTYDANCLCIANSGVTTSSATGGLESNSRLAEKIAEFKLKMLLHPTPDFINKLNGKILFDKGITTRASNLDIRSLIPINIWNATITEGSPTHLIAISNATDVVSADYYLNNQLSAAVLILKSKNGVYEHTKYICDRLEGASLETISKTNFGLGEMITYEIMKPDNKKEFAISFSGYIENDKFNIESHWNLSKYKKNIDFYNFQVWASSIEQAQSLVIYIMKNIKKTTLIESISSSEIPQVYVKNGYYKQGKIYLTIKNKNASNQVTFSGKYRNTETQTESTYTETIALNRALEQSIVLNTGYFYDMGLSMNQPNGNNDELFLADGIWSYDANNPKSTMTSFQVTPQVQPATSIEDYLIERNLDIHASILDYINIYRSMDAKWSSIDFSEFKSLAFQTSGNSTIRITLANPDIQDWNKQLHYEFKPKDINTSYQVNFEDLVNFTSNAQLSKINMITISMIGDNAEKKDYKLNLTDLKFLKSKATNTSNSSISSANSENINIYPIPANEYLKLDIVNPLKEGAIELYSLDGKLILSQKISSSKTQTIQVKQIPNGLYLLKIEQKEGFIHKTISISH